MTAWRWLGSMVLLAGLVLVLQFPAQAQKDKEEKVQKWKAFDDGAKPFYQILHTKTEQTMSVNAMEVKQNQEQWFYIKWTPDKKKDNDWVVTQKIIGVKMNIDIGGNKIAFDSTEANPPQNPMSDFFKALTNVDLKFYINSKDFTVSKIDNVDDFRKKLTATNPQMDALLKNILSEAALKQMAEPTWAAYPPDGKFTPMKKWEKKTELDLGPIGIYNFTNNYTCVDASKITITSSLDYKEPKKSEGLPFTIKKGSLSTEKDKPGVGEAIFDADKGRFKESKIEMKLKGELTIDIGGTETKVVLDQKQESNVKTQDDDPVAELQKKKG